MNVSTNVSQHINFKAKLYNERVQEKLEGKDWLDRNFCGATTSAKEDAEWEIRQEIDMNWSNVSSANNNYDYYKSYYSSQSEKISEKIKDIDSEVENQHSLQSSQETKIKSLKAKASNMEVLENESDKEIDILEEEMNKKRILSRELNSETCRIEKDLSALKTENETNIKIKTTELRKNAMLEHNKKIDNLITSPLLCLKQNVIMPVKMLQKGKDFVIPNGILINTPFKSFSKLILRWITQNTNSNYAKLNAKKYKTEEAFFEALSSISEKSRDEHEKTNKYSFTLITNIERFLKQKNAPIIPFLKSFMDTTATDNFNTIVLSSKKISDLDPILIAKHRFPIKIQLDSKFLFARKNGFISMLFDILKKTVHV